MVRRLAFLAIFSIISFLFSGQLFSQKCRVKIASEENGCNVYAEVFEYDYVDVKPQFPGGDNNLINFINSNRNYPQSAYDNGIEGRVTCAFVVNADGKISNIKILRGVEDSLNQEAIRIVSSMPPWTPGKILDQPVPVRVIYCIPFRK